MKRRSSMAVQPRRRKRHNAMDDLKASLQFADHPPYKAGILRANYAKELGRLVTSWPHLEEKMIEILQDLLGGDTTSPARQIFRSIASERVRIQMMTALLKRSSINQAKGERYDELIDEFEKLNRKRNSYVHGLWWTRQDGRLFLSTDLVIDHPFYQSREVALSEIQETQNQIKRLIRSLEKFSASIRRMRRVQVRRTYM